MNSRRLLTFAGLLFVSPMALAQPDLTNELMIAAGYGNVAEVKSLLDRGADVNARDSIGLTALMYGAKSGNTSLVKLLVARGADVTLRSTMFGYTALINAAGYGDEEMVELLIAKGAAVNARDDQGATALTFAEQAGKTGNVRVLKSHGGTK